MFYLSVNSHEGIFDHTYPRVQRKDTNTNTQPLTSGLHTDPDSRSLLRDAFPVKSPFQTESLNPVRRGVCNCIYRPRKGLTASPGVTVYKCLDVNHARVRFQRENPPGPGYTPGERRQRDSEARGRAVSGGGGGGLMRACPV